MMRLMSACVLFLAACASDDVASGVLTPEEASAARRMSGPSPVEFTTSDGRTFGGSITLQVDSEEIPSFSIASLGAPNGIAGTLLGRESAFQPTRALDGSYSIQFERSAESTDWLLDNLGTLRVTNDADAIHVPRRLDLRVDEEGFVSMTVVAIELILNGSSARFGDELTIQAIGRLRTSCTALGEGGVILADPEFALNESCAYWLSGFGS